MNTNGLKPTNNCKKINSNQIFTDKKKRKRKFKRFTAVEKALLKLEYEKCQKPNIEEKQRISDKYGLDKVSVNN